MKNKIKVIQILLFILLVRCKVLASSSTSKNLLREIDDNYVIGMDCSIYANSIQSYIIEYKQVYDSLNIGCHLHLKSIIEELKLTVDEMVGGKLEEYLSSINKMRSKIIEMKNYQDHFNLIKTNLTETTKDRNNLNEKYKNDLLSFSLNLTETLIAKRNLAEQLMKVENNFNQTNKNSQAKLGSMMMNMTHTLNVTKNLTEQILTMEKNFNQTIINYQAKLNSTNLNLTTTIDMNKNLNELIKTMDSKLNYLDVKFNQTLNEKINLTENLKTNENTFNQTIVNCQQKLKLLETNLTQKVEQDLSQSKVSDLIKTGDFVLGRQLFLNASQIERELIIDSVYNKNNSGAEKVIDFLNSFTDNETIIHGYRLLFDQMKKHNHIYSTPTTIIAYRLLVDFQNTYRDNQNLVYLKANLPESLKKFPWNQRVVIEHVKMRRNIWIQNVGSVQKDNLRLYPFIQKPISASGYSELTLNFVSSGKYFHIKSETYSFYLYAETDELAYDSNRRTVFAWMKKNETKEMGRWQLEPIEGSNNFKIKNIYWNEYLSAVEEFYIFHSSLKRLFTLRSGKYEDENCNWVFLKYTG